MKHMFNYCAIDWYEDELVEVTPKSIRMRKKVLNRLERGKLRARMKNS